ncbi:alpha/beta hydrolase family protein [Streptacidiphilus jiangxiensis]|uniref:Peptidase S9 prolyl oligopeptidase catalytic domain-containing protein n=1 Tax=Streptacidiphilus jiangxiensis TaxID=235985 RepID=A0A1H7SVT7_STRJI|nr:hypothetical protein [Streptacidiphilus jiangxiensis]SEL75627.1 hypothetical protein SAMN05414137_112204 [Streptacidiphilus jiangxiensis]
MRRHLLRTVRLAILLCVLTLLQPIAAARAADGAGTVATPVVFTGEGGVRLHGTVVAPAGATTAPRAGVVMLPGAGPGGQAALLPAARAYARRGVVALVYDKRTVGYSMTHRDYGQLAADALAGVALLRARTDVAPHEVGLWGLSEGAWPASIAAGSGSGGSGEVAFLITAGAVGLTPARQQAWAYGEFLGHHHVSGSLTDALATTGSRQLVGAGLFPEADYDPVPAWRRVHVPVLAEWGALDREAAPQESARIIGAALDAGGNTHHVLRFVPDVRHNLNLTDDDGFDRIDALPADYAAYEAAWIGAVTRGAAPASAVVGTPDRQDRTSAPLTPLAWYETGWVQSAVLTLLVAGFGGTLLRGGRRLGRAAFRTAAAGLAALLGALGYLLFCVVTAANAIGPVVLGRPLPWLALQLLALGCVAGAVQVAFARRRDALPLLAAAAVFVPWALYWGLLLP